MKCEGCNREMNPIQVAQCYLGPSVCFDCVKARAKVAATNSRCTCGSKRNENPEPHRIGSRVWYTCRRCLGTTRQVS